MASIKEQLRQAATRRSMKGGQTTSPHAMVTEWGSRMQDESMKERLRNRMTRKFNKLDTQFSHDVTPEIPARNPREYYTGEKRLDLRGPGSLPVADNLLEGMDESQMVPPISKPITESITRDPRSYYLGGADPSRPRNVAHAAPAPTPTPGPAVDPARLTPRQPMRSRIDPRSYKGGMGVPPQSEGRNPARAAAMPQSMPRGARQGDPMGGNYYTDRQVRDLMTPTQVKGPDGKITQGPPRWQGMDPSERPVEAIRGAGRTFHDPKTAQEYGTVRGALQGRSMSLQEGDRDRKNALDVKQVELAKQALANKGAIDQQKIASAAVVKASENNAAASRGGKVQLFPPTIDPITKKTIPGYKVGADGKVSVLTGSNAEFFAQSLADFEDDEAVQGFLDALLALDPKLTEDVVKNMNPAQKKRLRKRLGNN